MESGRPATGGHASPAPGRIPTTVGGVRAAGRSPLATDDGVPVDPRVRASAERLIGADVSHARVHQGAEDRRLTELLGARAATHGRDIFLAAGESATDERLLRHELTHVATGGDAVRLRSATWLERRAWRSFFSHYLPRKFLDNYMDDTGRAITLTQREMQDCNPIVNLRNSTAFMQQVARLAASGGGTAAVSVSGRGGALTNGTLGNFTVRYTGNVTVNAAGTWTFTGSMTFYDYWDFDPKGGGSNRPVAAEVKVRVANAFLPGRPFHIYSASVPVSQSSTDTRATWGAGAAPVHQPDRAGRTGADIAAGDVAGGPVGVGGADVGAEVGAQASEDLN